MDFKKSLRVNSLNIILHRFFLRRKTQIYSAMIFILPALVLVFHRTNTGSYVLFGGLLTVVFAILFPKYVAFNVRIEDAINLKLAHVTPSQFIRIGFHVPLVIGVYALVGAIGDTNRLEPHTFLLLLAAANGLHAIGVTMAYRGHGDRMGNIMLSFSLAAGLTAVSLVSAIGLYIATMLALIFFAYITQGVLSDLRAHVYPKDGIGVFFGTFNPVHKTHLRIMKDAIKSRHLKKIYIHLTTVPKLHRTALESGEIVMGKEDGMRVYKKTELADPSKNYFPTGNKFYEYEIRKELLKAGINDADLGHKVEVLDLPEIYNRSGFFGVLNQIKCQNKGAPIHGLHGSDVGGIWVRNIFDSLGWIYPVPIVRSDNISATAIREGAVGYTSTTIEAFLDATRAGRDFVFPSGYVFKNSPNTHHDYRIEK